MKKIIFGIMSFALLVIVAATTAEAATDVGIIKKVDTKNDSITLDDGKTFNLVEKVEAEQMKVGTKVQVTYKTKSGKLLATSVQSVQ